MTKMPKSQVVQIGTKLYRVIKENREIGVQKIEKKDLRPGEKPSRKFITDGGVQTFTPRTRIGATKPIRPRT